MAVRIPHEILTWRKKRSCNGRRGALVRPQRLAASGWLLARADRRASSMPRLRSAPSFGSGKWSLRCANAAMKSIRMIVMRSWARTERRCPQHVASLPAGSDAIRARQDRLSRVATARSAALATPPWRARSGEGTVAVPLWPVMRPDYVVGSTRRAMIGGRPFETSGRHSGNARSVALGTGCRVADGAAGNGIGSRRAG